MTKYKITFSYGEGEMEKLNWFCRSYTTIVESISPLYALRKVCMSDLDEADMKTIENGNIEIVELRELF